MAHFLYISDVFCPWCYGFSKNIAKIKEEFALPFEVYSGALVEPAVNLAERLHNNPNIPAFIEKMYKMTGVRISDNYLKMLYSANAHEIVMDSRKAGHVFYVLKQFLPGHGLEIMEFLQHCFYGLGKDIFSESIIHDFVQEFALPKDSMEKIHAMLDDENSYELAYVETEKSFDILADIVQYPTLYYVENGEYHFVSRGYVEYEKCHDAVLKIMDAVKNNRTEETVLMGKVCSLDGKCE